MWEWPTVLDLRRLRNNNGIVTSSRAQKEAEASNGGLGADTPPEDEVGGADDDLDAEADEVDDSPDDSVRKTAAPAEVKGDTKTHQEADVSSLVQTGTTGKPPIRGCESEVKVPESAGEANLPSLQRDVVSSSSNTNSAPPPTSERQLRRAKVKDREKVTSEPTSTSSRGSRQGVSGRVRVHSSRSNNSSEVLSNQISPVSSVSSSTSATIRLSPMSGLSPMGVIVVTNVSTTPTSSPRKGRKEDGWKEVGRR